MVSRTPLSVTLIRTLPFLFELRSDRDVGCSLPGYIRWAVIGGDSRGCGFVGRSLNRLSGYPLYSSSSTGTWSFSLHTNCGGHCEVYLQNKWTRVTLANTNGKERWTNTRQRKGRKSRREKKGENWIFLISSSCMSFK